MKAVFLSDRGVIKVAGEDARSFLAGLITADTTLARPGIGLFAALLTPQGKIITDMILQEAPAGHGGGFLLDCPRALVPQLVSKLNLYKLRAKVTVEDLGDHLGVMALWGGLDAPALDLCCADPRTDRLGWRLLIPEAMAPKAAALADAQIVSPDDYESHRIALRVPRGGVDFAYGDTFPHEANMDLLGGVSFTKGCYVGQEVVSRMQHRGLARTRIIRIVGDPALPEPGTPVMAGSKAVGTVGSHVAALGLALLRVDRVADASQEGAGLVAGGLPIRIHPDDAPMVGAQDTTAGLHA